MSYYIGHRWGWVAIGRRLLAWQDTRMYPYLPGWRLLGPWKVWIK